MLKRFIYAGGKSDVKGIHKTDHGCENGLDFKLATLRAWESGKFREWKI